MRKTCDNCKHGYKDERDKPCVTCQIPPYSEWEEKESKESKSNDTK